MVLVVLGVVALSVVAVLSTWGPRMRGAPPSDPASSSLPPPSVGERLGSAVAVLLFLAAALLCCWSYLAAVSERPGGVPAGWHPFETAAEAAAELAELERNPPSAERRRPGNPRPRWCKKCRAWKPERAHHCSVRGECVLRMDHYCVWVVNTVGLLNYKAFLLFLLYTAVAAALGVALSVVALARELRRPDAADAAPAGTITLLLASSVLDAAFGLAVLGFLGMHAGLVSKNMTTIEAYEKASPLPGRPWPYSAGTGRDNWRAVFDVVAVGSGGVGGGGIVGGDDGGGGGSGGAGDDGVAAVDASEGSASGAVVGAGKGRDRKSVV